jgi:DnaK suppressor protein
MLSKAFLSKVKEQLLAEQLQLTQKSNQTHDIDVDGDETDEIQGNILIEIENQLSTRNKEKLLQIGDALRRIEDRTYGLCQDCEEYIPEKRLSANLYFVTCVACAEDRERENRKRS